MCSDVSSCLRTEVLEIPLRLAGRSKEHRIIRLHALKNLRGWYSEILS